MALIAVAADKGAPGVTTTATALAAVWPRPVVLAECDPAGGDIVYRLPGAHGGRLDPRRGLLSLAVAARHGLTPAQVWEHTQRLRGGLDVLAGVTNAEQGSGIDPLWGPVGDLLATLPRADVIADCGRLGPDSPYYELLAQAAIVVLVIRPSLGEVLRLRDRVAAVALAVGRRGARDARIGVLVVADRRGFRRALAEVSQAVGGANSPVGLLGGIAYEPKSAQRLRGEWGGRLDRSLLIRTARDVAAQLADIGLASAGLPSGGSGSTGAAGTGSAGIGSAGTGSAGTGSAGTGSAGLGLRGTRPAAVGLAGAQRAAVGLTGARPPGAGRPAGAVPVSPALGTVGGAQETRAWAPGAREPAARASGRAGCRGTSEPAGRAVGHRTGARSRAGAWSRTGARPRAAGLGSAPAIWPGRGPARPCPGPAWPTLDRPGPVWAVLDRPGPAGPTRTGLGHPGLIRPPLGRPGPTGPGRPPRSRPPRSRPRPSWRRPNSPRPSWQRPS